jgi:hypothetical protein
MGSLSFAVVSLPRMDSISCELHLVILRFPGVGSSVPGMLWRVVPVPGSVQIRCPRLSSVLLLSSGVSSSSGVMPRERVSAVGPHPDPGLDGRLSWNRAHLRPLRVVRASSGTGHALCLSRVPRNPRLMP